ncbi:MAG: ATP-binding cassette domain-containing protein [candidate division WOR-3 bacterium]|nr:ATP-binding cassette domain-containing protein [candidate division WOR-3 bacterium]MCX7757720.1 ATP-binding cassette domain-containing protein [candidate division WOR-3 bacterium]MDW7988177.1 ATP-binding cassette domain-containing protein [candidate division WOR-3 bacterium]
MIKLINVTKIFGNRVVLDNISFTLEDKLIAILGATGSGKTVLLKIISGLLKPDTGMVILSDRTSLGCVFQHAALFDSLTVEENIVLPLLETTDYSQQTIRTKLEQILDKLNLSFELLKRKCHNLSGGERKLVAIARAIITEPCYMLYDEPTSGLDSDTTLHITHVIKKLKIPGVLVTHDLKVIELLEISERYLLNMGQLKKID